MLWNRNTSLHLSANLAMPHWKAVGLAWDSTLTVREAGQSEQISGHKQLLILSLVSLSLVTDNYKN